MIFLTYFECGGKHRGPRSGCLERSSRSDLGLRCLSMRPRNISADEKNTFVVIGTLRVISYNA